MTKETSLKINCSRYSRRITKLVDYLNKNGWHSYDAEHNTTYVPQGETSLLWKTGVLSETELNRLINDKQDHSETVGIVLFYENAEMKLSVVANSMSDVLLTFQYRQGIITNNRTCITGFGWYMTHMIQLLKEIDCEIEYLKLDDSFTSFSLKKTQF